jgi:hypothetical protein
MMSASSASSNEQEDQYAFLANLRNEPRKCFNCEAIGHSWTICMERMEDCFRCKTKFNKINKYHHPKDCPFSKNDTAGENKFGF